MYWITTHTRWPLASLFIHAYACHCSLYLTHCHEVLICFVVVVVVVVVGFLLLLWWTVFDEESKNIHPIPSQGRPTLCGLCVNISSLCFCLQSSLHAAESMHHSNKDSDCRCSCVWLHQTSIQTRSVVKKWWKTLLFGEISPTHCMFTRMISLYITLVFKVMCMDILMSHKMQVY